MQTVCEVLLFIAILPNKCEGKPSYVGVVHPLVERMSVTLDGIK